MKKVLIIGAGAQGNVIGWVLSRAPEVAAIVLADLDRGRAEETARSLESDKVRVDRVDASGVEEMAALMERGGFDLVVNAALPQFIPQVMEAARRAGRNYLDLSSLLCYEIDGLPIEQLQHAKEWEASGRTALVNAGSAPGLTNIMAREGVEALDTIDRIEIKDYSITDSDSFVGLWSLPVYVGDCATEPWIWEDGRPRRMPIFSGGETVDFPAPIGGPGKVYLHAHEEPVTIPLFVGKPVRYCDYKIGEPGIDTWRFIVQDLGMMDEQPIEVEGGRVRPRDVLLRKLPPTLSPQRVQQLAAEGRLASRCIMMCDVSGRKDGRAAGVRLWTESPDLAAACRRIPGASDVSLLTSVPAAVFSLMLLRGQIGRPGVVLPESFDRTQREIFLQGIAEHGIRVRRTARPAVA
jgi:saccharopine dehydrogenase-like NADP-dependent oxidoreductase